MSPLWPFILTIAAFIIAAFGFFFPGVPEPWPWRGRLICLSLACYFLAEVLKMHVG